MLPPPGTHARKQLEDEALQISLDLLEREHGNLLNALYLTYMEFRTRFIEERGLMDAAPGVGEIWAQALTDARTLEEHVNQQWAKAIIGALA